MTTFIPTYSNKVCQSWIVMFFLLTLFSAYQDIATFPPQKIYVIRVKLVFIPNVNVIFALTNCYVCKHKFTTKFKLKLLNFNSKADSYLHKITNKWNKIMKTINGNIIRVCHINKGKSFLSRSTAVLEEFLDSNVPDILSLNEANIELNTPPLQRYT